jgi:hypothetical protein
MLFDTLSITGRPTAAGRMLAALSTDAARSRV